jgi:hypothetical protein
MDVVGLDIAKIFENHAGTTAHPVMMTNVATAPLLVGAGDPVGQPS